MFGFKKRTVDDILSDIEKLTDEEKSRILGALSGDSESSDADLSESEEPETVAESAEGAETGSDETSAEVPETSENPPADVETDGNGEENEPLPQETPEEMPAEEAPVEEVPAEVPAEAPAEVSAPAPDSVAADDNTRELIEAQVAKINALESEIGALKEKIDNIVSNQDKQNFGLSPSADFSGDESSERRNAVLRGYAGRRANDYK